MGYYFYDGIALLQQLIKFTQVEWNKGVEENLPQLHWSSLSRLFPLISMSKGTSSF